jgi:hypothetical protein
MKTDSGEPGSPEKGHNRENCKFKYLREKVQPRNKHSLAYPIERVIAMKSQK